MKRIFLLLLTLMASCAVGNSQESGVGPGELGWQRYTVKGEEFSVTLPSSPRMETTTYPRKDDGKVRLTKRLKTSYGSFYFSIDAFENPQPKQSLEQFVDELGLTGEYEYDPATKRQLNIDGFDGIEYSSTNKAVVQFLATEKHLYRFIASGPGVTGPVGTLFFSSIKLGKKQEGIEVEDTPGTPAQPGEKIYTGKEVDVKARLLTKPEPGYTDEARKNDISGTVVLKAVFSKNGTVTNIRTIYGLPYGLTERAIDAARKIKFIPAMKDGQPVSMWMQLEYNFYL